MRGKTPLPVLLTETLMSVLLGQILDIFVITKAQGNVHTYQDFKNGIPPNRADNNQERKVSRYIQQATF